MMRRLLFFFILLLFGYCAPESNDDLKYVSITYDSGDILRIARPWSNDLIRWSEQPYKHGLKTRIVRNEDSICYYRNLLHSITVDSAVCITSIPCRTTMQSENIELEFNNKNDLPADAMIVYHYNDIARSSDSIFISFIQDSPIRFNSFLASADSLCWAIVRTQIIGF